MRRVLIISLTGLLLSLALDIAVPADVIIGRKLENRDLSGFLIPEGQVLDLGGETVTITKPIFCYGEIRDGVIDATGLQQHEGAIYFPANAKSPAATKISVKGGSYNGAIKVWANGSRIVDCSVTAGTGWGVQILGADNGLISGWKQQDTARGGIYFGDGSAYGTKTECLNWTVEKSTLVNSRWEAVFRANTARGLKVRDCFFDNSKSESGKEAVQPRGREMAFERCVIINSTSSGQQPNGVMQTSEVKFSECTIYGYNSIEAGGNVTFARCLLIHRPSWTYNGTTYTLSTPGNGCPVNPQSSARGLPDGKALLQNCTVDAKELTKAPKRVRSESVKMK